MCKCWFFNFSKDADERMDTKWPNTHENCPYFFRIYAQIWQLFFLELTEETNIKHCEVSCCMNEQKYSKVYLCAPLGGEHKTKTSHKLKGNTNRESVHFCLFVPYFSPLSNVPQRVFAWGPILERSPVKTSSLKKKSSNNHCPLITRQLFSSCVPKSPVRFKVHWSPTQAPQNRSVRLREPNPEQRGAHYPHSTSTERPDSILHYLPVMRLSLSPPDACRGRRARPSVQRALSAVVWVHLGAIRGHTHTPLCRLALCEINASTGTSNKFCISTDAAVHAAAANQSERRELRGRDKRF